MSASGKSPKDSRETPPPPPNRSTVILLLGTIADTTWRMFVPTITTILLGFWADNSFGTKPWLTILGIVLGTTITALLIKRQLDEVKKTI